MFNMNPLIGQGQYSGPASIWELIQFLANYQGAMPTRQPQQRSIPGGVDPEAAKLTREEQTQQLQPESILLDNLFNRSLGQYMFGKFGNKIIGDRDPAAPQVSKELDAAIPQQVDPQPEAPVEKALDASVPQQVGTNNNNNNNNNNKTPAPQPSRESNASVPLGAGTWADGLIRQRTQQTAAKSRSLNDLTPDDVRKMFGFGI